MVQLHQHKAPKQEPYKGQFAQMDFPPYSFKEYPKVIGKREDGSDIIAENQREELEFIARGEVHHAKAMSEQAERDLAVELASAAQAENAELKKQIDELKALMAAQQPKPAAVEPKAAK